MLVGSGQRTPLFFVQLRSLEPRVISQNPPVVYNHLRVSSYACRLWASKLRFSVYPIPLTVDSVLPYYWFRKPLVRPFDWVYRAGSHPSQLSVTIKFQFTLLTRRFAYFIFTVDLRFNQLRLISWFISKNCTLFKFKHKKGNSSKKDELPVVPPSLAKKLAHLTDIIANKLIISVSYNDETVRQSLLIMFRFGAQKSIHSYIHTDFHQPSAL